LNAYDLKLHNHVYGLKVQPSCFKAYSEIR
jgi:hypothetical protein